MTLKEIWIRTIKDDSTMEFEEFEELLNDWAWEEYERQRSANVNGYQPKSELPVEGF